MVNNYLHKESRWRTPQALTSIFKRLGLPSWIAPHNPAFNGGSIVELFNRNQGLTRLRNALGRVGNASILDREINLRPPGSYLASQVNLADMPINFANEAKEGLRQQIAHRARPMLINRTRNLSNTMPIRDVSKEIGELRQMGSPVPNELLQGRAGMLDELKSSMKQPLGWTPPKKPISSTVPWTEPNELLRTGVKPQTLENPATISAENLYGPLKMSSFNKQADIDPNDFAAAVNDMNVQQLKSDALKDVGTMGLAALGAGVAGRGLIGLFNVIKRNQAQKKKSGPAMLPFPIPIAKEAGFLASGLNPTSKSGLPWYGISMLGAGLGGLAGGYYGTDAILNARREAEAKAELENARKQFHDALLAQYDKPLIAPATKKKEETNVMQKAGEDLNDLWNICENIFTKQSLDLGNMAGMLTSGYGMYGGITGLVSGALVYNAMKKRSQQAILEKALQRRDRRRAMQAPTEIYAVPETVEHEKSGFEKQALNANTMRNLLIGRLGQNLPVDELVNIARRIRRLTGRAGRELGHGQQEEFTGLSRLLKNVEPGGTNAEFVNRMRSNFNIDPANLAPPRIRVPKSPGYDAGMREGDTGAGRLETVENMQSLSPADKLKSTKIPGPEISEPGVTLSTGPSKPGMSKLMKLLTGIGLTGGAGTLGYGTLQHYNKSPELNNIAESSPITEAPNTTPNTTPATESPLSLSSKSNYMPYLLGGLGGLGAAGLGIGAYNLFGNKKKKEIR